ncbi:permease [Enterococcus florum]|uniref:Permease n=1 Tax=Enterococcus florum TaxID=2480627 RepID=A0A4P5PJ68_9ENTE|nr:EamA family transporter RarD [Enterococcus florum]GCF95632.1 permease [Enterococcus florum]
MLKKESGVFAGIIAYVLWGILPFYWKLMPNIGAVDILFYRIVWSLVFMMIYFVLSGKLAAFWIEFRGLLQDKKSFLTVALAAVLISCNWGTFIYTVHIGQVQEASLGYYINPLFNVLAAAIYLKEPLTRQAKLATASAAIGVLLLTIQTGKFPLASIIMAATFCIYGVTKKKVVLSASASLTIETMVIAPVGLVYLIFFSKAGFMGYDLTSNLLTMGAGIVTAIPLLLFAYAAKKMSYVTLGFIQYIAPTIMLLQAVFVFHEPYGLAQLAAFSFIWLGILIFIVGNLLNMRKANI